MLLGAKLNAYTDHFNLTFYGPLNTQTLLRWRIYVNEYSHSICHIMGWDNVLTDTYSCLPRLDSPGAEGNNSDDKVINNGSLFHSPFKSSELFGCVLNLPVPPIQENPLDIQWFKQYQDDDSIL